MRNISSLSGFLQRLAVLVSLAACLLASPAFASKLASEFAIGLEAGERKTFQSYIAARQFYNLTLDEYWAEVAGKKAARKTKRASDVSVTAKDYVTSFPPDYAGPKLPDGLAKRWTAFQAAQEEKAPPSKPRPGLAEFLGHAKDQFGFVPERIDEREFKRRYAEEALSIGLTKDQVVRVYALETSGLGTADMVAGIHPITKKGSPISTAIGYAQLLAANSTSELVKYGPGFVDRLRAMARRAPSTERAEALADKAEKLARMTAAAKTVPNTWDRHVAYARTPKGLGVHAINMDGDIGPWLQVIKLAGLKELAEKRGRPQLNGAEIELMNLAGPATGLEMMQPAAKEAATANFFARDAYGRNTIVRGKTAAELLVALDQRMNDNIGNAGAIVFNQVFDEAAAARQAAR